jgi:hypothetical protein
MADSLVIVVLCMAGLLAFCLHGILVAFMSLDCSLLEPHKCQIAEVQRSALQKLGTAQRDLTDSGQNAQCGSISNIKEVLRSPHRFWASLLAHSLKEDGWWALDARVL